MLFPLTVAFVAVALGAVLALSAKQDSVTVRVIRIAAIVASAYVILTHLLPEAVSELGWLAAVAFAAGVALPMLVEAVTRRVYRSAEGIDDSGPRSGMAHAAGVEIAFVGLVVHRFGDGLSMGAYSEASTGFARVMVVLAIAAHIVPVTTLMILAVVAVRGRRSGVIHAAILAVSTMAGVVVAALAVQGGHAEESPWISAAVAGLLVHIVAHDLPWRRHAAHSH